MQNLVNKKIDRWVRPWNVEKFNELEKRDERFFSIVLKGVLGWLTRNIVLYNKPIKHFIFNTGSTYMYLEDNGYTFSWTETSGEDTIYMEMPRCLCELGSINIPTEELTSPFVRGVYERKNNGQIQGFNAEMRRLPLEIDLKCRYVLSNFNESIVLLQEIVDKLIFQKYFKVVYLGQTIDVSIEWPSTTNIGINKIDMTSPETNQKNIEIDLKICTTYPQINERTEMSNDAIIAKFGTEVDIHRGLNDKWTDEETYKIE